MAKGAGDTRASKWSGDIYSIGVKRYEYRDLPKSSQAIVRKERDRIAKAMYAKLQNVSTPQVIDGGEKIDIRYTKSGIDEFANQAMVTLSGKYFSEKSMLSVNEILGRSSYVPTPHTLSHPRKDKRDLWFSYKDADGRGVYFRVCWNQNMKMYELYSVADRI